MSIEKISISERKFIQSTFETKVRETKVQEMKRTNKKCAKNHIKEKDVILISKMENLLLKDDIIIVYHGSCPDGISAAWCLYKYYKFNDNDLNMNFIAGYNSGTCPLYKFIDKNVIMVDFVYPAKQMDTISKISKSLLVLDHHKTTEYLLNYKENITIVYDEKRSGSQITWDYYFPDMLRPWFIDDIADRDLWTWKINGSRESCRGMLELGYYDSVSDFISKCNMHDRDEIIKLGKTLLQADEKQIKKICSRAIDCYCSPPINDDNKKWNVRLVEADGTFASEIGEVLTENENVDFAAIYRYDIIKDVWNISLRASKKKDIDLTEVAKRFHTGGGHPKASAVVLYGNKGQDLKSIFEPVKGSDLFNKI